MAKQTQIDKQQATIEKRPTKTEKQQAKAEKKQAKAKKKHQVRIHSSVQKNTTHATGQTPKTECSVTKEPAHNGMPTSNCPPLPAEVWSQILSSEDLDLTDIKNARLTCNLLAGAGIQRQFHTLAFRRDREDFQRLEKMLQFDKLPFVKDIRAVRFESGWLDPNSMARTLNHDLVDRYIANGSKDNDPVLTVWDDPSRNEAMDEYITWYDQFLKCKQNYEDSQALKSALLKLSRLERIDITRRSSRTSNKQLFPIQSKSS